MVYDCTSITTTTTRSYSLNTQPKFLVDDFSTFCELIKYTLLIYIDLYVIIWIVTCKGMSVSCSNGVTKSDHGRNCLVSEST